MQDDAAAPAMRTALKLGVDRFRNAKPERLRISLRTRLRSHDRLGGTAHVLNLSSGGFMAESEHVKVGSDVMIDIPGFGWTLANVRWVRGDRFGARFASYIDLARFWRHNPSPSTLPAMSSGMELRRPANENDGGGEPRP